VSRYLRHLEDVLLAAGVRHTRESRAHIHAVVQKMTGESDCPRVWRRVRAMLIRDLGAFRGRAAGALAPTARNGLRLPTLHVLVE